MNNKSELLQKLKIDRSEAPEARGLKLWHVIIVGLLCAVVAVGLTLTIVEPASNPQSLDNEQSSGAITAAERSPEQPPSSPKPAAPRADNDTILNSSGYITARRMATVSAEIMGLITEVNVEEGMAVSEGQVLARLDDALVKVSYDLAKAQIEVLSARRNSIMANLEEARRNNERAKKNRFSSESDRTGALALVQSLTADLESAEADIRVAYLEVKRQQERLADHTIRAPFAGVVTVKNAQPGEIVAPSSAGGGFTRTGICTIVDMQSLEIEVDVNESFIGRVFPGQPVEAHLDAYQDWTIPASVIAIIPTADRAKATVQVRIKIELTDPRILPDMGVKVAFLKKQE